VIITLRYNLLEDLHQKGHDLKHMTSASKLMQSTNYVFEGCLFETCSRGAYSLYIYSKLSSIHTNRACDKH